VEKQFWKITPLAQMSDQQWESLCDGCGRCCVHKFQDEDTEELLFTNVACQLLDCETARCSDYPNRLEKVAGCIKITPQMLANDTQRHWLPSTCAYRLIAEDKPLFDWHPLIAGNDQAIMDEGIKLAGGLVPESEADLQEIEDSL
jgi:uncharacterized cysteine cluster protein YcgN (CxxCxxCC family)